MTVTLVERRVADDRVLALIGAWLRAGIMEQDRMWHDDVGVPSGRRLVATPLAALLHRVGDVFHAVGAPQRTGCGPGW